MKHLVIAGGAGNIEAVLEPVAGSRRGAVVCHPHPLYGGSMYDAVVEHLCDGFSAAGVSPLRFNFRGVGASEGAHDRGAGEADDVLAVCRWFHGEYSLESLYLGGYSFGAGIALRVAPRLDCQAIVVVAPPLQMLVDNPLAGSRTLVILGEKDEIVDCNSASEFFADRANVDISVIGGADHFFVGAGDKVTALATGFVSGT